MVVGVVLVLGLALAQDYEEDGSGDGDDRKASVKGKCKNSGPKPKDRIFAKYTKPYPANKCPCWWDLTRTNCACCEEDQGEVMQCGWPMHKFCYKKSDMGCPGVCNNKYTLSGKGFPCQNDPTNFDCAWCAKTGFQCLPDRWNGPDSRDGSRCQAQNNQKYCKSVQGDCRHIQGACPPEQCVYQEKLNKYLKYHECECPDGYTGNGLQCKDSNGTWAVSADQQVEVEMVLTTNLTTFPFTGAELTTGAELQSLITEMNNVDSSCSGAASCSATFNSETVDN